MEEAVQLSNEHRQLVYKVAAVEAAVAACESASKEETQELLRQEETRNDQDGIIGSSSTQQQQQQPKRPKIGSRQAQTLDQVHGLEDDPDDDKALDRNRRLALVRAKDTEQSKALGTRRTLFGTPTATTSDDKDDNASPRLPQSSSQATEYLNYLVTNNKVLGETTHALLLQKAICKPLKQHIAKGTLQEILGHEFATSGTTFDNELAWFVHQCRQHDISSLPQPLVQWLFSVACSGGSGGGSSGTQQEAKWQDLSEGACRNLVGLWMHDIACHTTATCSAASSDSFLFLTLSDLSTQLGDWFGCRPPPKLAATAVLLDKANTTASSKESGSDGGSSPSNNHQQQRFAANKRGLQHFLELWEVALTRELVYCGGDDIDDNDKVLEAATTSVVSLIWAGMDSVFHSHETCVSPTYTRTVLYSILLSFLTICFCLFSQLGLSLSLQRLLAAVLDLCANKICKGNHIKLQTWMALTAKRVLEDVLDGTDENTMDTPKEQEAQHHYSYLSHALAVRLIPLESDKQGGCRPNIVASEFACHLAMQSLQQCLGEQQENWSTMIQSTLSTCLNVSADRAKSLQWQAIASSYVALRIMDQKGDNGTWNNGPKCLATVELSYSCLQAAITLFSNLLAKKKSSSDEDEDDDDDDDDYAAVHDHEQDSANRRLQDTDAIFQLFELVEKQTAPLVQQSSQRAIGDRHIQRANYHFNCIRQYIRLEKLSFKRPSASITSSKQSSLESWFKKKGGDDATPQSSQE
jgi:hypothetical protein